MSIKTRFEAMKANKKEFTRKQMVYEKQRSFNNGAFAAFIAAAGLITVKTIATTAVKCATNKKKKDLREEEEFEDECDYFADDPDSLSESDDSISSDDDSSSADSAEESLVNAPEVKASTATVQEEEPSEPVVNKKPTENVEDDAVIVQKAQVPTVDDKPITPEEIKEFADVNLDAVRALAEYIDTMPTELRKEVGNVINEGKFPKVEGIDPDAVKRLGSFMMNAGIKEDSIPESSEDKSEDEKSDNESSTETNSEKKTA